MKKILKKYFPISLTVIVITIVGYFIYSPAEARIFVSKFQSVQISDSIKPLINQYKDMLIIDVHNHDASGWRYGSTLKKWDAYRIDKTVLFGNVAMPGALRTDKIVWNAFKKYPDRIIPFFQGFDLHDPQGLYTVKSKLEQGYYGIGEIYAASSFAIPQDFPWKGKSTLDGILPEIYELCAEYKVPILLHIDPPEGKPMITFEKTLSLYPETIMIFAHGNVYNTPDRLKGLLERHPNIYIDFFPGFNLYNRDSNVPLKDFIPVILAYPDRFFLSTDSGFAMKEEQALEAMYQTLQLINDDEVINKVAGKNFMKLIEMQPATRTQKERIRTITSSHELNIDIDNLTKIGRIQIYLLLLWFGVH